MVNRIYSCISVASKEYIQLMVKKGLLIILKEAFTDCNESIFEQILWTLCNIVSESSETKIELYEIGIYHLVINTFNLFKKSFIIRRTFSWLISNTLRIKPFINSDMVFLLGK